MKQGFAGILEQIDRDRSRKVAAKLPGWAGLDLEYPDSLCLEQCSSEKTAAHKAALVSGRVADLTGGLGVDSLAFSKVAEAVFYNEMNPVLCAAAERNFRKLGATNITCHNFTVSAVPPDPGGLRTDVPGLFSDNPDKDWIEALRSFRPDWIYADPARRAADGRKVFLLEDCSPDILTLLPILVRITPHILLKLSPMADLKMLESRLGERLQAIQVIASGGEVKELLCILGLSGDEVRIDAVEDGEAFSFYRREEEDAVTVTAASLGKWLLEPKAALLKSGAFKLPCTRFGISKLAGSTHLYTSDKEVTGRHFKSFAILESAPLDKRTMKETGRKYPHAEVSARNIPMSSEELRSRLGIKPGPSDGIHIFGCTVGQERMLITAAKKPA